MDGFVGLDGLPPEARHLFSAYIANDALGNAATEEERDRLMTDLKHINMRSKPVQELRAYSHLQKLAHRFEKEYSSKTKIVINAKLSMDEQNRLVDSFPGFIIDFASVRDTGAHVFARVHRRLSVEYMLSRAGIGKLTKPGPGYDVNYKDIGGNPVAALTNDRFLCHCCAPTLDINDALRNSRYQLHLRTVDTSAMTDETKRHYNMHFMQDGRVVCNTIAENCLVKAPVLLFVHSSYNIKTSNIAKIMYNADAQVAYGCFIFDLRVLYQDCGYLEKIGAHFRKFRRGSRIYIRFWFPNDTQLGYEHDFYEYIALVRAFDLSYVSDSDVRNYAVDVTRIVDNVLYFEIHRVNVPEVPRNRPFRTLTDTSLDEMTVINYWHYDTIPKGNVYENVLKHIRSVRLVVPTTLFENLLNYTFTLPESKFTVKNIVCAATSLNNRCVTNGAVVRSGPKIPALDLQRLAHAVFVIVYISTYECTKTLQTIIDGEKRVRESNSAGIFSRFITARKDNLRRYFGYHHVSPAPAVIKDFSEIDNVVTDDGECHSTSIFVRILDSLLGNFRVERELPVEIANRFVRFFTVEKEIDQLIQTVSPSDRCLLNDSEFSLDPYTALLNSLDGDDDGDVRTISAVNTINAHCNAVLNVRENFSSSDCVLQSLADSGVAGLDTLSQIADRLRNSRFLKSMEKKDDIHIYLDRLIDNRVREFPPVIDLLMLCSLEYHFRACIHDSVERYDCLRYFKGTTVHFSVRNEHCEYMEPESRLQDTLEYQFPDSIPEEVGDDVIADQRRDINSLIDSIKTASSGDSSDASIERFLCAYKALDPSVNTSKCGYTSVHGLITAESVSRAVNEHSADICLINTTDTQVEAVATLMSGKIFVVPTRSVSTIKESQTRSRIIDIVCAVGHNDMSNNASKIELYGNLVRHANYGFNVAYVGRIDFDCAYFVPDGKTGRELAEEIHFACTVLRKGGQLVFETNDLLAKNFFFLMQRLRKMFKTVVIYYHSVTLSAYWCFTVQCNDYLSDLDLRDQLLSADLAICDEGKHISSVAHSFFFSTLSNVFNPLRSELVNSRFSKYFFNRIGDDSSSVSDVIGNRYSGTRTLRSLPNASKVGLVRRSFGKFSRSAIDDDPFRGLTFDFVDVARLPFGDDAAVRSTTINVHNGKVRFVTSDVNLDERIIIKHTGFSVDRAAEKLRTFFSRIRSSVSLPVSVPESRNPLGIEPLVIRGDITYVDPDSARRIRKVRPLNSLPPPRPDSTDDDHSKPPDGPDCGSASTLGDIARAAVGGAVNGRMNQESSHVDPFAQFISDCNRIDNTEVVVEADYPAVETGVTCNNRTPSLHVTESSAAMVTARASLCSSPVTPEIVSKLAFAPWYKCNSDTQSFGSAAPTTAVFPEGPTAIIANDSSIVPSVLTIVEKSTNGNRGTKATTDDDRRSNERLIDTFRNLVGEPGCSGLLPYDGAVHCRGSVNTVFEESAGPSHDPVTASIREYKEMIRLTHSAHGFNCNRVYSEFIGPVAKITNTISDDVFSRSWLAINRPVVIPNSADFGILSPQKKWVIRPSGRPSADPKDYSYYFNGKDFVAMYSSASRGERICNLSLEKTDVVVNDYCLLASDGAIYSTVKDLVPDSIKLDDINFVQAVAGAGKTTYIIENHRPVTDDNPSNVILCTTEGKDDFHSRNMTRFRKRFALELGVSTDKLDRQSAALIDEKLARCSDLMRTHYRTLASVLMHPHRVVRRDTLYIDEAFMHHPGALFLAIHICGAKYVHILGDSLQIPYVNRLETFTMKHGDLRRIISPKTILNHSYRCPSDVASLVSVLYEDAGLVSSNTARGMTSSNRASTSSMSVHKYNGVESLPTGPCENIQFLTFTQSCKRALIRSGKHNVNTIHEYEGKQAENVILVRDTNVTSDRLPDTVCYLLVAITRHTFSFRYYSKLPNDRLWNMIINHKKKPHASLTHYVKTAGGIDFSIKYNGVLTNYAVPHDYQTFTIRDASGLSHHYSLKFFGHCDRPGIRFEYRSDRTILVCRFLGPANSSAVRAICPAIKELLTKHRVRCLDIDDRCFRDIEPLPLCSILYHHVGKEFKYFRSKTTEVDEIPYQVFDLANRNVLSGLPNKVQLYQHPVVTTAPITPIAPISSLLICDLQGFIDDVFGPCAWTDQSFDSWMVHHYDLDLTVDRIRVIPHRGLHSHKSYDTMSPVLRTPVPHVRCEFSAELLVALQKRNCNVPEPEGIVDIGHVTNVMVENLVDRCFDKDAFLSVNDTQINVTPVEICEWLRNQPVHVVEQLSSDFALHDSPLNEYIMSIKTVAKPILKTDADESYAPLQTILFHEKFINAIFCPIFREIKARVHASLKSHLKIFSDISMRDFVEILDRDIADSPFALFSGDDSLIYTGERYIEVDISKYDKSQGDLALEFELKYMRLFGVPDFYIQLWKSAHIGTTAKSRSTGAKIKIDYQRKSGDASTFLGNTLFLMGVLAYVIDFSDLTSVDYDDVSNPHVFTYVFNLETKFFSYEVPYFCSKFLIRDGGRWFMVPDPVKLLCKLGRHDLVNPAHVECYRVSLSDHLGDFSYDLVNDAVSRALRERYYCDGDYTRLLRNLPSIVTKPDFSQLFFIADHAVIDYSRLTFYLND
uniref:ORF1 n=2 Tax=unclassified Riboviria TaxID=2585030 RepID=A0A8E8KRK9_9VIRU|nr:ORF1 [Bemisia tabaci nege-like virus 2]